MSFGEYLKQLRKDNSISQRELAEKTGISNAEISRIESGERQKPSPDVLRAIAPILNVQYEELMDKAGYLNSRATYMTDIREAEEKFIEIITPKLIKEGWIVELCKKNQAGDILAKRDEVEWYLDFKFFRSREDNDKYFRDDMMAKDILWRTYGRLAIYDGNPITKFTLAVNSERAFNTIIKFIPKHLKISVSIMLINLEEGTILEDRNLT